MIYKQRAPRQLMKARRSQMIDALRLHIELDVFRVVDRLVFNGELQPDHQSVQSIIIILQTFNRRPQTILCWSVEHLLSAHQHNEVLSGMSVSVLNIKERALELTAFQYLLAGALPAIASASPYPQASQTSADKPFFGDLHGNAQPSRTQSGPSPDAFGGQVSNPALQTTTINNQDGTGAGTDKYHFYTGDGTTRAGWPSKDQWVSFEDMFVIPIPARCHFDSKPSRDRKRS